VPSTPKNPVFDFSKSKAPIFAVLMFKISVFISPSAFSKSFGRLDLVNSSRSVSSESDDGDIADIVFVATDIFVREKMKEVLPLAAADVPVEPRLLLLPVGVLSVVKKILSAGPHAQMIVNVTSAAEKHHWM